MQMVIHTFHRVIHNVSVITNTQNFANQSQSWNLLNFSIQFLYRRTVNIISLMKIQLNRTFDTESAGDCVVSCINQIDSPRIVFVAYAFSVISATLPALYSK